ncbi:MAG: LPS-assembly protein LptD, partial [Candidatus Rokubacteria bacterium]|nr:LPS-assembly protein LptD [Candidatus Rokubacteria bacterium]
MSLPFFWVISESQDLTVAPRYFEKRGVGFGAEYRFARSERSRGEVAGFFIHDTETQDDRYVLGLRHEERFTDQLTLKADLGYVSDDQYLPNYGDTLDQRSRQRGESNLSVTQRWPTWNLVGNLFYYQDL